MLYRRLLVPCIGLTVLLAGCLRWPGPTSSPRTLALFGGQEGYELICVPALARVELYRLTDDATSARRIAGIPVADGPATLDDAALKKISEILRDEASYNWTDPAGPSTRPARPTAALRFAGTKKTIDLLFSFADNTLIVFEGDKPSGRVRLNQRGAELAPLLSPADH